jgi:2,4-dienoyl-CoA reductase-like NADH-dependent reductase (Old Yellow Enzyme family)
MTDPLFSEFPLRGLKLKNRIVLSPMCQYSAENGLPGEWHFRHYAERAVGGAALVVLEATAVSPDGRISPGDLGLWSGEQEAALTRLAAAVHGWGAKAAVQLAHAGRKASTSAPWEGGGPVPVSSGGWGPVSVSSIPFDSGYPEPKALSDAELSAIPRAFAAAAERAARAGFDAVEIHAAHGYLLHQSLSPLSNERTDAWGGTQEGRFRLTLETAAAVRRAIPETMPLLLRLSATDWVQGGWDLEGSVALAERLKLLGVDLVDVSSGGLVPRAKVVATPGYQVPFSNEIRRRAALPVGAVGLITEADQARRIVADGSADLVFLGRLLLRDPYWPLRNAPAPLRREPRQYRRAF